MSYEAALAPYGEGRVVDALPEALSSGRMPPLSQPQPSAQDKQLLIDWARCLPASGELSDAGLSGDGGTTTTSPGSPMHSPTAEDAGEMNGLGATRKPLTTSGSPPAEATAIPLTMDEFNPPATGDRYETRTFASLVSEDMFVRYIEPVIDDARVVHHLTVRFANERAEFLYLWAPGGGALEFPDGGIRLKPADELTLEVHYSNGVKDPSVHDSSGARLYVGPASGTEYGVANPGTWRFLVPANESAEAKESCSVESPARVFAALPHMHQIGASLTHTIVRADGSREDLITVAHWDFHGQQIYAVGEELAPGDRLELTCRYDNPYAHPVYPGQKSSNEMCFDFLFVTPPDALPGCNDGSQL